MLWDTKRAENWVEQRALRKSSYFLVHLFIWTPSSTSAEDKGVPWFLIQAGFLLPSPFARVLSTTLRQCIPSTFCRALDFESSELSRFGTPRSQLWTVVHIDVSCSWLGPETVAHRLDSSPSCLAAYVYIQCIWYLAMRSAMFQVFKPKLKEQIWVCRRVST